MKKISPLFLILYSLFLIPSFAFAQFSPIGLVPFLLGQTQTGQRAAQNFYNQFPGKPIPLSICNNITELNENFWKPEDILRDFEQTKQSNQVGVIILVKTEACCKNQDRPCATTTAAFEKESTPLLDRFKIYGIQVAPGNVGARDDQERIPWKKAVKTTYQFQQGPGAKIVVMLSDGKTFYNDATALGLLAGNVKPPELGRFLTSVIAQAPKPATQVLSSKLPVLYTDPPNCGPCRTLENQLDRDVPGWRDYIKISKRSPVGSIPYLTDSSGKEVAGAGQIGIYKTFIAKYVNENKNIAPAPKIPKIKPKVIFIADLQKPLGYRYNQLKKLGDSIEFKEIDCKPGKSVRVKWSDGTVYDIPCPSPGKSILYIDYENYTDVRFNEWIKSRIQIPIFITPTAPANNPPPNIFSGDDTEEIAEIHEIKKLENGEYVVVVDLKICENGVCIIEKNKQISIKKYDEIRKKNVDKSTPPKSVNPKKPLSQPEIIKLPGGLPNPSEAPKM